MLRRGGRRPRALSSTTINELAGTSVTLPENFTTYTIDQGDSTIVHTATDGQGISFVEQYIDGPTVETVSAHTVVDEGQTTLVQAGGHYVEAILEDDGDVRVIQLQEVVEGLSPPTTRGRGRGRGRVGGMGGLKRAALAPVASVLMGGPPKRRRPGRRPITELQAEDENSLCYIIREQKATVQQVVEGWVQSYWLSRDGALLSLTQFFFNASGCKGKITQNMQATMEYTEIISKMAEEFDDQMGSEYPLVLTGTYWKKFRENIAEFIQRLIKHGHKERPPLGVLPMLHDQCLMDNLVSFLTALSDSNVRAFRHTATFAGIKLMTALVDVIQMLVSSMEGLRRHAGLLKGYRSGGGSMTVKRQEMEENMEELRNMLGYTFKSIFAIRYRDTLPEIRSICMAELGLWMYKYPSHFLTDSYLKYIGWSLNDRIGIVRLNCLQALQPLYDSELHRGKLELFTSKFKSRIVEMRADKEYEVAVEAVKLITSILKYQPDALTPSDCEQIYELLYEVHRGVALAAGEFLKQKLFIPKTSGIEKASNTELLCDLVIFFTAHQLHEHALYLVDSLIDGTPILKDWDSMIKLLLYEDVDADGEIGEGGPLNESQQIALVEIMSCAIRQAATGDPPLCRGTTRKVMTTSELKQVSNDRALMSEHLLKALPQLLSKFMQHPDAVKNLMAIPQFCDLQLYSINNMEEELDGLLQLICQAMQNHSDREVLKMSVKTLEKLCEMGSERFPKCEAVRAVLTDSIVSQFKNAMQHQSTCNKQGELPDMTELLELSEITHKLAILYGCHDVGPWGVWDSVFETVQNLNTEQLPDEVLKHCMSIAYFSIIWDFACLMDNDSQGSSPSETRGRDATHLELLRTRVIAFVYILRTAIHNCPVQVLREEAFILLCDLLIHLRNGDYGNGPSHCRWGVLPSYPMDDELQELLNEFIQREVFTDFEAAGIAIESDEDEQKKYELHRRRCFLASFCKLIVYNVMPITVASDIFKHYLKFGEKYGDIIKATLSKARDINKVECARTMVLSLMTLFSEMCDKNNIRMKLDNADEGHEGDPNVEEKSNGALIDRQSEEFLALKEMAKRFALSFGLDSVKNREAVTALHRDGILFAVQPLDDPLGSPGPPPNLPFLEILAEFTFKLLNQDKRVVLSYLDQRIATGMASGSGEDWRPLLLYRNSLVHGESTSATPILPVAMQAATANSSSDCDQKSPSKSSPKAMRRHIQEEDEEEEDDVQTIIPTKLQMEEVVVEPSTEFFTGPTVQLSLPFNQSDCIEEPLPCSSMKSHPGRLNIVSYLHRPTVGYPRSWIPAVSILPGYNEASASHAGVRTKREKSTASGTG